MLLRASLLIGQSRLPPVMLARSTRTSAALLAADDESPERDLTNFPRLVRQMDPGRTRIGFLPDEWFQMFYERTGITGPYTLGVGFATFMISKEYFVMEHEYYTGLTIALMSYLSVVKLGGMFSKYCDQEIENYEKSWSVGRETQITDLMQAVKDEEDSQWEADGQLEFILAKRENVALQLEEAYRKRLMLAYHEVKNRLDFQVSFADAERRIAHKNLIAWVVKHVLASFTPDLEKQYMDSCITNLDEMFKKLDTT